jgi:hypothetical protein
MQIFDRVWHEPEAIATAEHCTGVLSENKKSCMRVPFYVLGVTKPSSGFGWSKVPFKGSQVVIAGGDRQGAVVHGRQRWRSRMEL